MVFQRFGPSRPWTLDGAAVLDQPLPAIAHDSDGYAIASATDDPSLLLPPDVVGPSQAAVVDEGPASAGRRGDRQRAADHRALHGAGRAGAARTRRTA